MHPLDLQYITRCLWFFFSSVIALQLLDILAARVNNGKYLQKNISKTPLKFEDASPVVCIQEKGYSEIISAAILFFAILLATTGGSELTTPIGTKQTIYFITTISMSFLAITSLLEYRNCLSILTHDSLYICSIKTLFRTVRIPLKKIEKYERLTIQTKFCTTSYGITINTEVGKFNIIPANNWECFMDAIEKLKTKTNTIQDTKIQ